MVGGTLENNDLFNGGADVFTIGVFITQAFLFPLLVFFSVSPREKDSKFSPTREGVLEQTEEPVDTVVDELEATL